MGMPATVTTQALTGRRRHGWQERIEALEQGRKSACKPGGPILGHQLLTGADAEQSAAVEAHRALAILGDGYLADP